VQAAPPDECPDSERLESTSPVICETAPASPKVLDLAREHFPGLSMRRRSEHALSTVQLTKEQTTRDPVPLGGLGLAFDVVFWSRGSLGLAVLVQ